MEVTTMKQNESDQIWQHLQDNIEGFFSRTIADDVQKIEYKRPFIALLEMSSEHNQSDQ
jgi:hypothetical protein